MMNPADFDLAAVQRWMQSILMHPQGIGPGLESPSAQSNLSITWDELEQVVAPSPALSSAQRLAIYHHGYFARLFECMNKQFPALQHALGEELFREFTRVYLYDYPSTSYTLAELGRRFPDFLEETRPDRTAPPEERESWPDFMIELARLEWTTFAIFDGPGTEGMSLSTRTELAPIIDADPAQWPLAPAPCLRLFRFSYPVNEYYDAVRRGQDPELPLPQKTWLAVTRKDFRVGIYQLKPLQYVFLNAIQEGQTVCQAIAAAAAASNLTNDDMKARLRTWLATWFEWRFFGP